MIQGWNDFRLHLNAQFSTIGDDEAKALLRAIQAAVERHDAQAKQHTAADEDHAPSDDEPVSGVSWDKVKGKWRVVAREGGRQRGFGRFDTLPEANAQARGVRAVYAATGRLPKVGWRVAD